MQLSKYRNKIVLVIGGTGFIGTNLCTRLLQFGAKVYVVHKNKLSKYKKSSSVFYYLADVTVQFELEKLLKKIQPDYIFHLAADITRDRNVENFRKSISTNLLGLLSLLESLVSLNYKIPLVIAGTAEEYGNNSLPFKENMQEKPISPYSLSKVFCTYLAKTFYLLYSLPIVTLRPTIAYGPGQKGDMFIPSLVSALKTNKEFKMTAGEQTRDFIFIEDLVDAYLLAGLCTKKIAGEIINVGYGKPYKLKYVAAQIGKFFGNSKKIKYGAYNYRAGELMQYFVDNSKAKRLLGWKPKITLKKGLKKTLEATDKYE